LLTPAANLPPVSLTSTTLGKMMENFAAGVIDTGAILPPVSLKPVVHLDSRISNGLLWGWGETDS
jgi:hypothetical protein